MCSFCTYMFLYLNQLQSVLLLLQAGKVGKKKLKDNEKKVLEEEEIEDMVVTSSHGKTVK